MEIEKITTANDAAASRIYALSWKAGYKGIVPQDYLDALPLDRWAKFLADSPFFGYILTDEGKACATSSISKSRDEKLAGWGEIISLYALPECWDRGYGKRLFHFDVDTLREMGFERIYLWVLEENVRARKFYERNGFVANGDRLVQNVGGAELAEVRYVNSL